MFYSYSIGSLNQFSLVLTLYSSFIDKLQYMALHNIISWFKQHNWFYFLAGDQLNNHWCKQLLPA